MNSRERFLEVMNFGNPDRTMLWEFGYWAQTLRRWYKEGLPKKKGAGLSQREIEKGGLPRNNGLPEDLGEDQTITGEVIPSPEGDDPRDIEVSNYLGLDKGMFKVPVDNWIFPPFKKRILEEKDDSLIIIDQKGIKMELFKKGGSMPHFLDWPISSRDDFEKIKERFKPNLEERLPVSWPELVKEYKNRDYPLALGGLPVGFFGSLRDLIGLENLLFSYYDNPKLIKDILDFLCDFWINLWSEILCQVEIDYVLIWEDMSYKNGMLVSSKIFREFMLPHYKRLTGFLVANNVEVICVDSDGDCKELIPLLIEGGVMGMNPFEAQAGMNIVEIRKRYPRFQIIGGLDKRKIALGKEEIDKELEAKVPFMLREGGYIPSADHLVPPDVSWSNFIYYRKRLKEMIEKDGNSR